MLAFSRMPMSRWLGLALALVLWAPVSQAALFSDDEARKAILDLRQRLEQSNEEARKRQAEQLNQLNQLNEQITQMRRSLLELNSQIEAIRAENAQLRGLNEQTARDASQVAREVAELQRKQRDIQQGVEDRVRKLEPQMVSVDNKEFLADPEEKRIYEEAMGVLRQGEFDKAAVALAGFQRRYPASGYGESALFWLGNAQYGKRDYKEAIASFRALVTASPDHPRAPEALLSIANCQIELKDTRAARRTIDELAKAYPGTEAAKAGKERLALLR